MGDIPGEWSRVLRTQPFHKPLLPSVRPVPEKYRTFPPFTLHSRPSPPRSPSVQSSHPPEPIVRDLDRGFRSDLGPTVDPCSPFRK